jgi:hypothetical protein
MKRGIFVSIGLLMIILYINGCAINDRGVDPGLENDPGGRFHAHDHQRGEGFGLFNQQRDRKNPIANIIARDERPGRGMNGILDRRPPEMNRRISSLETADDLRPLSSLGDENYTEQVTQELLQMDMVRDFRIITYQNQMLVAVDSDTTDPDTLQNEIIKFMSNKFPNKDVFVITDRHAIDRIRLLDNGFQRGETEDNREFFDENIGPIAGQ